MLGPVGQRSIRAQQLLLAGDHFAPDAVRMGSEREVLERVDPFQIDSSGYSFLEEMVWHVHRHGFRIREIPIVFEDRTRGDSKIDSSEIYRAAWHVLRTSFRRR